MKCPRCGAEMVQPILEYYCPKGCDAQEHPITQLVMSWQFIDYSPGEVNRLEPSPIITIQGKRYRWVSNIMLPNHPLYDIKNDNIIRSFYKEECLLCHPGIPENSKDDDIKKECGILGILSPCDAFGVPLASHKWGIWKFDS